MPLSRLKLIAEIAKRIMADAPEGELAEFMRANAGDDIVEAEILEAASNRAKQRRGTKRGVKGQDWIDLPCCYSRRNYVALLLVLFLSAVAFGTYHLANASPLYEGWVWGGSALLGMTLAALASTIRCYLWLDWSTISVGGLIWTKSYQASDIDRIDFDLEVAEVPVYVRDVRVGTRQVSEVKITAHLFDGGSFKIWARKQARSDLRVWRRMTMSDLEVPPFEL